MARPDSPVRLARRDLGRLLAGAETPPAPRRRRGRWQHVLVQAGLLAAIGLTVAAARYLQDTRGAPEGRALVLAVASTVPPALAVRRPLWAWRLGYPALFLGVMDVTPEEAWPWNPVQVIGWLFVLVTVAARTDTGVAAWAGLLTLLPVYLFVDEQANAHGVTVLVVILLVLGDQIRRRRQSQAALVEQAEVSERERDRRAVLEERARIARELHDVVAHHMSMIAVQAESAPYRLGDQPERTRAEFTAIAGSARAALADMRRLLGVLRNEAEPSPVAPQPGLPDVPGLVDTARRAGMTVTLAAGPPPAVPAPVGLAAYRIAQEALANAARHAPGAAVRVTLRAHGRTLTVRVENDPAPARPAERGSGHGLTGMRERALALGGTFTAGHTADGGYAVHAELPWADTEDGNG
ncbi:histidine kinase [Micromonospora sp. NPDC126480]|uniref:sensor histidine kinase n=1 Tax=Micromonospora sp. NPDC126480 TaxID=3155312 RepID=UPI00332E18EB